MIQLLGSFVFEDNRYKVHTLMKHPFNSTAAMRKRVDRAVGPVCKPKRFEVMNPLINFSEERIFRLDQKFNEKNCFLCSAVRDVSIMKSTKIPCTLMVLGGISGRCDVVSPSSYQEAICANADAGIYVVSAVVDVKTKNITRAHHFISKKDSFHTENAHCSQV